MGENPTVKTQPIRIVAEGHRTQTPPLQVVTEGGNPIFSVYGDGTTDFLLKILTKTASHTLELVDAGRMIEMNAAGVNTLTVPPQSDVNFPIGTQIMVSQYGAGQTSIAAGAGVTIRSEGGALNISGQYSVATLIKRDINEWYLVGGITA